MKKILMGGFFTVILLVMMPLAPAIQINAIENQINDRFNELNSKEISIIDLPEKFPLLYAFVRLISISRFYIGLIIIILSVESVDPYYWFESPFEVERPLLFLLGAFQMARTLGWNYFWFYFSVIMKLEWFEWPAY
jgi:hypothetical protein